MADVFLYFFAFLSLIFAVGTVLFKHPMRSALSLISVMVSLAAVYAILEVHVIAVFQVLIYVGAIMVFMVYVIMLMDTSDESYIKKYSKFFIPSAVSFVLVVIAFVSLAYGGFPDPAEAKNIFSFKEFSAVFMKDYVFHFELASVVLLVAIVGAITVIKGKESE